MALTFSDALNERMDFQPISEASRIIQAIERVLQTPKGKYPFDPEFGVNITPYIGQFSEDVQEDIKDEVKDAIESLNLGVKYEVSTILFDDNPSIIVIQVIVHLGSEEYLIQSYNNLKSMSLWMSEINMYTEFRVEKLNQ